MVFENPLYHGTDAYVISMSEEERQDMKQKCFVVIDLLYKLYERNEYQKNFDKPTENKEINDLNSIYSQVNALINKSSSYEYECTYLTQDIDKAAYYAKFAYHFGELGYFAWKMLKGLELTGYRLPEDITEKQQAAIDSVIGFADHDSEPVIFTFKNIPIDKLMGEMGCKEIVNPNVRYIGNLDFSKADSVVRVSQ
ncbi:MAG: hypothetical protein KBT11_00100 [Treponema sp.]|nr:hypothetical protein [Candidatus Treponema equifaecale]